MEALAEDDDCKIIDITPQREAASQSIREIAAAVNADWRSSIDGIVRSAHRLAEAKRDLPKPLFELLLGELHFGIRTANRLISIGASRLLTSGTHVSRLPEAWGTLYELSRLPESQLECAFAEELIHPRLERRELPKLIERVRARMGEKPQPRKKVVPPSKRTFAGVLVSLIGYDTVRWVDGLDDRTRLEFIKRISDFVLREKDAADAGNESGDHENRSEAGAQAEV